MHAIEHLEETKWIKPESYAGFSPDGDYLIYSQHRDSDCLSRSNYRRILEDLLKLDGKHQTDDTECFVYDFRASHWAVGWVEYILVKQDAPEEIKQAAGEIICALSDYPVYDESDWTELEHEEISNYWEGLSVNERMQYCKENNVSIFAARKDYIPENDGSLDQSLLGY